MRERFIGAILLGNNLANIAASALATSVFLTLFGREGVDYRFEVLRRQRNRITSLRVTPLAARSAAKAEMSKAS
jgi:Mg2+/Co2+ transporter CorB